MIKDNHPQYIVSKKCLGFNLLETTKNYDKCFTYLNIPTASLVTKR